MTKEPVTRSPFFRVATSARAKLARQMSARIPVSVNFMFHLPV
jgi:hypothetical protein